MILDMLKIVGHYLLWIGSFYCLGSGSIGTVVIIRDAFKKGAYTRIRILEHAALLVAGIFILKGLLK